ncbi:DNA cytosine methyltransferase [Polaromonas sp. A23]|uniref:DNA cytosine methyltransferase n=1 Tax=Polaromonas sp. A23 TaxID=1944133 RepID=UPI00098768F7|nr:DNA cytosine methyltransferase [Polaromonas sp. A23]OOG36062.1 DNA (cytosine-5-)-methyltransferase [Polaromonas sp. A23]
MPTTTSKTLRRPIGIDLFAGVGGLSLGFEAAGFDIAAAVELDPIHCAAHKFNFPHTATICKSVIDVTGKEIRAKANLENRDVDVVFGGAPCQGFSLIGKRALDDPRNQLVHHFVRIVKELRPKYFVFENVKGLTLGKHRQFLDEVIDAFQSANYEILLPYKVLNAVDYGVPQSRERLFLIGARKGQQLPEYPAPAGRATVRQAIGDLPEAEQHEELWTQDWVSAKFGRPSKYASVLRGQKQDPFDFSHPRNFDSSILTSSALTAHTPLSRKRFAETAAGSVEPISRFLKLNPSGVCNTLRAGTASDRGAFTSPRPIHPFEPRVITVREAARIHSYPDWFRFNATKWHGFRQIGNSVPPLLGRAIASSIMESLEAVRIKPDQPFDLGPTYLLSMAMREAARFFGVSQDVISRKRIPQRSLDAPLLTPILQQELAYS